jgi:ABC-type lipoprotein release transport system permease subunit
MNPLSPFTYYRRHKGAALLLIGLVASLTLGLYSMAHILNTGIDNAHYPFHYLTRMSRISAAGETDLSLSAISAVAGQIRTHPDVVRIIPENGLSVFASQPGGPSSFPVLGVAEADLPAVMAVCDLRLKEGRLVEPRTAEVILSEELARALDLQIGDSISHEIDENTYPDIMTELTLVGILESVPDAKPEVRVGYVSYEYLDSHELYSPRLPRLLIIPGEGSRENVNEHLETLIQQNGGTTSVRLETFERESEHIQRLRPAQVAIYGSADILVTVAAALVVGMINRIAITRRLPEFGLLQAVGYQKRGLIRRLALEIAATACVGWGAGLVGAHASLILLKNTYWAAHGWVMNMVDPAPFLLTLPIPLVVIVWVYASVNRLMNRLDTIAIIERGQLSGEEDQPRRKTEKASYRPLSALTFYARHRRRGFMLIMATGLMVSGVAFPAFILNMMNDSVAPLALSYSSQAGVVSPSGSQCTVDPTILAQIKAHPAVAHVIPVKALAVMITIPPGIEWQMPVYGIREQELDLLLDVYGLRLDEGSLIQPRSNQLILTRALAQNRGVNVGDVVGEPVCERDGFPTEVRVVGLLESTGPALAEREGYDLPPTPRWAGFASYEFVEDHERYAVVSTHALVIPVEGRESEMEAWLEESVDSPRVKVTTLGTSYREWRRTGQGYLLILAAAEFILAVVAVIGLAILNYIFFTQRRDEFGTLHAVGHSRLMLTTRTLQESVSIVGVAWLIGAVLCMLGVFWVQANILTPVGMDIDISNLTPWLFTLPIPLAVVAASVGTVAWALARLDPVAVIERR